MAGLGRHNHTVRLAPPATALGARGLGADESGNIARLKIARLKIARISYGGRGGIVGMRSFDRIPLRSAVVRDQHVSLPLSGGLSGGLGVAIGAERGSYPLLQIIHADRPHDPCGGDLVSDLFRCHPVLPSPTHGGLFSSSNLAQFRPEQRGILLLTPGAGLFHCREVGTGAKQIIMPRSDGSVVQPRHRGHIQTCKRRKRNQRTVFSLLPFHPFAPFVVSWSPAPDRRPGKCRPGREPQQLPYASALASCWGINCPDVSSTSSLNRTPSARATRYSTRIPIPLSSLPRSPRHIRYAVAYAILVSRDNSDALLIPRCSAISLTLSRSSGIHNLISLAYIALRILYSILAVSSRGILTSYRVCDILRTGYRSAIRQEDTMKKITPERDGKRTEYRAELDGELVGYFKTYQAAQTELDRLALEAARRAA